LIGVKAVAGRYRRQADIGKYATLLTQINSTHARRLRSLKPGPSIRAMFRNRFSRQLISGIAVALLLLCQSAGSAFAGMPQPGTNSAVETCHGTATTTGDTGSIHCAEQCPALRSAPESSNPDIPAATDFPALTVRADFPPLATPCTALPEPRLLYPTSPPLPIVLCRLLN